MPVETVEEQWVETQVASEEAVVKDGAALEVYMGSVAAVAKVQESVAEKEAVVACMDVMAAAVAGTVIAVAAIGSGGPSLAA